MKTITDALFIEAKKIFKTKVETVKPKSQQIIEEIHRSFDEASDSLLAEAKRILAGSYNTEKAERLKKIGFVKSNVIKQASEIIQKKQESEELALTIEYYQINYPNNKFITYAKAEEICAKYGLLMGDITDYIGDVPEKNLTEIENFKLKNDEMVATQCGWYNIVFGRYIPAVEEKEFSSYSCSEFYLPVLKNQSSKWGYVVEYSTGGMGREQMFFETTEEVKVGYVKNQFKICAPKSDFDLTNKRIEGHLIKEEVKDPIVLQPVDGGLLVVSKWGLEAEDKDLVNEKMN